MNKILLVLVFCLILIGNVFGLVVNDDNFFVNENIVIKTDMPSIIVDWTSVNKLDDQYPVPEPFKINPELNDDYFVRIRTEVSEDSDVVKDCYLDLFKNNTKIDSRYMHTYYYLSATEDCKNNTEGFKLTENVNWSYETETNIEPQINWNTYPINLIPVTDPDTGYGGYQHAIYRITTDEKNNSYVIGFVSYAKFGGYGIIDVDSRGFIQKFNSVGKLDWTYLSAPTSGNSSVNFIEFDNADNIFIVATENDITYIQKINPKSEYWENCFLSEDNLCNVGTAPNVFVEKKIAVSKFGNGGPIEIDAFGNIYINQIRSQDEKLTITKLNNNLEIQWTKEYDYSYISDGSANNLLNKSFDSQGNLLILVKDLERTNYYLIKLNSDGELIESFDFGTDFIYNAGLDSLNNIFILCSAGLKKFNGNEVTNLNNDAFGTKLLITPENNVITLHANKDTGTITIKNYDGVTGELILEKQHKIVNNSTEILFSSINKNGEIFLLAKQFTEIIPYILPNGEYDYIVGTIENLIKYAPVPEESTTTNIILPPGVPDDVPSVLELNANVLETGEVELNAICFIPEDYIGVPELTIKFAELPAGNLKTGVGEEVKLKCDESIEVYGLFEVNKNYSAEASLSGECGICEKNVIFNFKENNQVTVPDNGLIGMLMVLSIVVGFAFWKKVN